MADLGDCHIVIEPIEGHVGYEFVDEVARRC